MSFVPLDDSEAREGTIISPEFFQQLADNVSYLIDSMPVGTIVPIMTGFTNVPDPDPSLWQYCDGSIITNPNSPIYNQATPNLSSERSLIKCAFSGSGTTGGSNVINTLGHNHTGYTEVAVMNPSENMENDNWYFSVNVHRHEIVEDLNYSYDVEPPKISIKHYIKIL